MLMQVMLASLSQAWQILGPEQILGRERLGRGVRSPSPCWLKAESCWCVHMRTERKSGVTGRKEVGGRWGGEGGRGVMSLPAEPECVRSKRKKTLPVPWLQRTQGREITASQATAHGA